MNHKYPLSPLGVQESQLAPGLAEEIQEEINNEYFQEVFSRASIERSFERGDLASFVMEVQEISQKYSQGYARVLAEKAYVKACKEGDMAWIEYMTVQFKVDFAAMSSLAWLKACEGGDLPVVQYLYRHRDRLNLFVDHCEPSRLAIDLEQDPPVDSVTALGRACLNGHMAVVQFLMKQDEYRKNLPAKHFNHALVLAAYHEQDAIMDYLLGLDDLTHSIKKETFVKIWANELSIKRTQPSSHIYHPFWHKIFTNESCADLMEDLGYRTSTLGLKNLFTNEQLHHHYGVQPQCWDTHRLLMAAVKIGSVSLINYVLESPDIPHKPDLAKNDHEFIKAIANVMGTLKRSRLHNKDFLEYLIYEKNVPEPQEDFVITSKLISDMFLFRKLNGQLPAKSTIAKKKI